MLATNLVSEAESKFQKYKELQEDINVLVFKKTKSVKDFEKLDRLYNDQNKLCEDSEVMNLINQKYASNR